NVYVPQRLHLLHEGHDRTACGPVVGPVKVLQQSGCREKVCLQAGGDTRGQSETAHFIDQVSKEAERIVLEVVAAAARQLQDDEVLAAGGARHVAGGDDIPCWVDGARVPG